MDDNGHRENGRHKADQYKSIHTQWMMPNHQMKDAHAHTIKFMAVMAERDKAIQERNVALSEKKAALAERDIAILQRDAAIAERNTAFMERDNAVASLEYTRENGTNGTSGPGCPPGCSASHLTKHVNNHQQQHRQHVQSQPSHLSDAPYNTTREMHMSEAFPTTALSEGVVKVRRAKRQTRTAPPKKISKSPRKNKRGGGDDLNKQVTITVTKPENEWRCEAEGGEDLNKQVPVKKHNEWKEQDLGLNLVAFDESMVRIPVCSCTGKYRQCYKWGNGGWQSACCTTTLSIYPLPVVPNKRHARLGGRKMSGSAFSKLLRRLAAEGHDLSKPLDLKDHWSKHGTNRYITIK